MENGHGVTIQLGVPGPLALDASPSSSPQKNTGGRRWCLCFGPRAPALRFRRPGIANRKFARLFSFILFFLASAVVGAMVRDRIGGESDSHDARARKSYSWRALSELIASSVSTAPLRDFELLFLEHSELNPPQAQAQRGFFSSGKPSVSTLRTLAHQRLHALMSADAPDPHFPSKTENYYRALTRLHTARYILNHGGRLPPPGYDEFVRWAADRGCEVDDYGLIDEDLEPYRKFYAGRPEKFKEAAASIIDRYPNIYGIKIRNRKTVMDYTSEFEIEMRAKRAARRNGGKGVKNEDDEPEEVDNSEEVAKQVANEAKISKEDDDNPRAGKGAKGTKPRLVRRQIPDGADDGQDDDGGANGQDAGNADDGGGTGSPPASAKEAASSASKSTGGTPTSKSPGKSKTSSGGDPDVLPGETPIVDWMKEVYPPLIDPFAYILPDMDIPFNFYDEPRMFVRLDDFLKGPPMSDSEAALISTIKNRTNDKVFRDLVSGLEPSWHDWSAAAKKMGCVDGVDQHGFFLGPTTLALVDLTERKVPMLNSSDEQFWVVYTENLKNPPLPFPSYPEDTPDRVLLPIFGGAKPRQCFADITLPSYAALTYGSYPWGWDQLPTWDTKTDSVYWRGTTTGGWMAGGRDWRKFHRQRLIKEWADRRLAIPVSESQVSWDGTRPAGSVHFDIFLTGIKQCDDSPGSARDDPAAKSVLGDPANWAPGFEPSVCDLAHKYYDGKLVKQYKRGTENVTVPEFEYWTKHWSVKYLIDLDGNAWSQRFQQFMWSNSLILHAGVFREWFSGWFRAWEHWIPIRMDLSDLEKTVRWAAGTDEGRFAAKRISENAKNLGRRRLRHEDMQSYLFLLLIEYGNIGAEQYIY